MERKVKDKNRYPYGVIKQVAEKLNTTYQMVQYKLNRDDVEVLQELEYFIKQSLDINKKSQELKERINSLLQQ